MAASRTTSVLIPEGAQSGSSSAPAATVAHAQPNRRRRITPEAGHALEILGHAIEYLTDEFVHESARLSADDGRFEAVQLLMALNRQVYFECPEVQSFGERCRSILSFYFA